PRLRDGPRQVHATKCARARDLVDGGPARRCHAQRVIPGHRESRPAIGHGASPVARGRVRRAVRRRGVLADPVRLAAPPPRFAVPQGGRVSKRKKRRGDDAASPTEAATPTPATEPEPGEKRVRTRTPPKGARVRTPAKGVPIDSTASGAETTSEV